MTTTLTETRIEIADRHTTLYHLRRRRPLDKPLPLGDASGYKKLYARVVEMQRAEYGALAGRTGTVLDKIFPVYSGAKYWRRYLGCQPDESVVWEGALPLCATIKQRVEITVPYGFDAKLSPLLQVLLYPFGWSTWISIRITGEHSIEDLVSITVHLLNEESFQLSGAKGPLRLSALFGLVSEGIRADAFGGRKTHDYEASEFAIVDTVLAKHGGGPALGALGEEEQGQLMYLVRPTGGRSRRSFDQLVFRFQPKEELDYDLNYMIADKLGRFIWMEKLLKPEGRNHQWLSCYHNNSFMALVQAWHFEGLLSSSMKEQYKSPRLQELMTNALDRLKQPPFENASQMAFLQLESVQRLIEPSQKD
jgi:hypothetical protein